MSFCVMVWFQVLRRSLWCLVDQFEVLCRCLRCLVRQFEVLCHPLRCFSPLRCLVGPQLHYSLRQTRGNEKRK